MPQRGDLGKWATHSLCFSSLGLRSSLWQELSRHRFDRLPSCWPFLLSRAFFGLQRWPELSSSKQESFGTKSSNFCLKLISPTPVEHSRGLCSFTVNRFFHRRTSRPSARAPASRNLCFTCPILKKKKILAELFLHLIIWEFCGTCAYQLDSSFPSHACHIHWEPVSHL